MSADAPVLVADLTTALIGTLLMVCYSILPLLLSIFYDIIQGLIIPKCNDRIALSPYTTLIDSEGREMRLKAGTGTAPLNCTLQHLSLDSPPRYEALSYTLHVEGRGFVL
jgi:hypothetical protein